MELTQLLQRDRGELIRRLEKAEDVKAAGDILTETLDKFRVEASGGMLSRERLALNRACAVANEGCRMIASVAKTNVDIVAAPESDKATKAGVLSYLPSALSTVLAVMLCLESNMGGAIVAIVSAAAGIFFKGKAKKDALPQVTAVPAIDAEETARRFEALLRSVDTAVADDKPEETHAGEMSQPLVESLQMLMEAQLTRDGAFALRTIPQVETALTRDGIVMIPYSEENKHLFDLLPAPEGGETIRPALMRGGNLIARGQATCKAE